jgi:hypothetical protein
MPLLLFLNFFHPSAPFFRVSFKQTNNIAKGSANHYQQDTSVIRGRVEAKSDQSVTLFDHKKRNVDEL